MAHCAFDDSFGKVSTTSSYSTYSTNRGGVAVQRRCPTCSFKKLCDTRRKICGKALFSWYPFQTPRYLTKSFCPAALRMLSRDIMERLLPECQHFVEFITTDDNRANSHYSGPKFTFDCFLRFLIF